MIFLINPPVSSKAPFPNKVQSGLACLKKYIKEFGYHSKIIDTDSTEELFETISKDAEKYKKNIFCFTALTYQIKNAQKINNRLKKKFNNSISIFGGACATGLGKKLLIDDTNIDFVIKGEGEKAFLKLLEHIFQNKNIKEVPSVIYRTNNIIKENTFRDLLEEKELFLPDDIDFKDLNIFYDDVFSEKTSLAVFSRGCVFDCAFCMTCKIFNKYPRYISTEKAYAFIKKRVFDHGIKCFVFDDDNFLYNKDWVKEFCLKITPLKIKFRINASLRHIDENTLLLLKKAGLKKISIGIETIFEDCQKIIRKKIDLTRLTEIIEFTKKENILTALLFICALPLDNYNRSIKTLDLIKKLSPNGGFDFQIFQPHPGTFSKNILDKYGKILTHDYDEFFSDNVVYIPNDFNKKEIFDFFNKRLNKEISISGEEIFSLKNILQKEKDSIYIPPENYKGEFDSCCEHWQGSKRCSSGLSIIKCQFNGVLQYNFNITQLNNEKYKLVLRIASHVNGFPEGSDYDSDIDLIINNINITNFKANSIHTTGKLKIIDLEKKVLRLGENNMKFLVKKNGFSIFNIALNDFFKKYETGIFLIPQSILDKHLYYFSKYLSD